MKERSITEHMLTAVQDTPVILLNGARQTGKSTLARHFIDTGHFTRYLTLDDSLVLAAAHNDPDGFVRNLREPTIIDEVQRAPELFTAIKAEVDRDRRPGRFFLTGSADVFLLPRLSESLAGRMEIFTLWPFSQGERLGIREKFIDAVFAEELPPLQPEPEKTNRIEQALAGGFPEATERATPERRDAWFRSYITTILQRDVRDLANIEGLSTLPRLLSLLAARSSSLLNASEIARSSGLPLTTLKRYMALLQATFLVREIPAWSGNIGKRLVKAPKLLLTDTGLLASLLGIGPQRIESEPNLWGMLLETFVAGELLKQITWSAIRPALYHFRSQTGTEVDCLLETNDGRIVGIEVKGTNKVEQRAFRGLQFLAEEQPQRFQRGILLYGGDQAVPFSDKIIALPISALWRMP